MDIFVFACWKKGRVDVEEGSEGTSNLFTALIGITQSITTPCCGPNEAAQKTGELVKCYCWEAIIQQSGWLMQENDIH